MKQHNIQQLEIHIIHNCNLACKYCSHYCDYGYGGIIDFDTGAHWIRDWAQRLKPKTFRILGGEPTIHKELDKYILCAAEHFKDSERDVVTNGLLLRRVENLFPLFVETGTNLCISLYPVSVKQQEALEDALKLAYSWKARGLKLTVKRTKAWGKNYLGEGDEILPFAEGHPEESHARCSMKICTMIHQGKLWKCAPLAFLPLIADRLKTKSMWEHYLTYTPLETTASDADIAAFFSDYSFCDMCSRNGMPSFALETTFPEETLKRYKKFAASQTVKARLSGWRDSARHFFGKK